VLNSKAKQVGDALHAAAQDVSWSNFWADVGLFLE